MGRTLTAREVGHLLGVSSKTVRDWANDGVLKGVKTDNGPGKEGWEFREDDVYSCPDTRVSNRLRPAEVDGRRNAQQRIEDLENEIESLEAAKRSLQAEHREREGALAAEVQRYEKELGESKQKTEIYVDAFFAAEKAIQEAIEAIRLKRDVERLFEQAGIGVEHRMTDDGKSWNLRYQIGGIKAWYELPEHGYEPNNSLAGLNRYLLTKEAGEFRDCHNPSREKLQARRALYGIRLIVVAAFLILLGLLLMGFGVLATWSALGMMASALAAVALVNLQYWIMIEILKRR